LNGKRYTHASIAQLQSRRGFIMVISWKDRVGAAREDRGRLRRTPSQRVHVGTWVMSYRAFRRRIEHRFLEDLFEQFGQQTK
jgi:predicted enzyme involved in methoxymalonyl-ACP biosynthesis